MGKIDTITTLEARPHAGQREAQEMVIVWAELCVRTSNQRLMWLWFKRIEGLLAVLDRSQELFSAASGVDPAQLGWRDAQDAVRVWLKGQDYA